MNQYNTLSKLCSIIALATTLQLSSTVRETQFTATPRIGTIEISGDIKDAQHYIKKLTKAQSEPEIIGIFITINSRGGQIGAAENIHHEIIKLRKQMPVVTWIENECCSAAYLIASASSMIIAPASSVCGNTSKNAWFIKNQTKSQENPVVSRSIRINTHQNKKHNNINAKLCAIFGSIVSESRGIEYNEKSQWNNAPLTGKEAYEAGLIDSIGGYSDALEFIMSLVTKRSQFNNAIELKVL